VYFLLAADRRLLYVGQTTSLRRRLADHARTDRWAKVARVQYEPADSQPAALAREADVLAALRPPWNKNHVDARFTYVSITSRGLALGPTGEYGCFPHLGKGASSAPGRACIDGYDALYRIVRIARPEPRSVHDFLSGRSDRLLRTELDIEQPHLAHGVRRDRILARGFYQAGPVAMRRLRLRHFGRGCVRPEQFVAWIAGEVDAVLDHGPGFSTGL
jgi:predicted GIY-YIG superfamily endonuclease